MDWTEWAINAVRDLVLLSAGGAIAWLAGLSAAKRTERLERDRTRTAAEAADKEILKRESRRTLDVVTDVERHLSQAWHSDSFRATHLSAELAIRLRATAAIVPDLGLRESVDNYLKIFDAFEDISAMAEPSTRDEGPGFPPLEWQQRITSALREIASATARGEVIPEKYARWLRALAENKALFDKQRWAQPGISGE